MEILGSLLFAGNLINKKNDKIERVKNKDSVVNKKKSQQNLYESNNVKKAKNYIYKKAKERDIQSNHPRKTCVIPKNFNAGDSIDSVYTDDFSSIQSKISLNKNDHMALLNRSENLKNNKLYESKIEKNANSINHRFNNKSCGPAFANQFDDLAFDTIGNPAPSNGVEMKNGITSALKRAEIQRELDMDAGYSGFDNNQDMTYGLIKNKSDFVHNNMVPFFSGKSGYGNNPSGENARTTLNQRKLDLFTGSINNIDYRAKTEQRPLFNPTVGMSHIYGMPNFNDYFEGRYVPGKERRGEKPFQEIKVTPGLNLGYNQDRKGLVNDFRVLPRSIDEIRTAQNRQISYTTPVTHGMKGHRRAVLPNVSKRRQETFKENDPRDMVKSQAYYTAPTIYGEFNAPQTNRSIHSIAWNAPAKYKGDKPLPWDRNPKFKKTSKVPYKHRGPGNAIRIGAQQATPNINSFDAKATNRETYSKNNHIGNVNRSMKKPGHTFDMETNKPQITLKDMVAINNWVGGVNRNMKNPGHAFDMKTNVPDVTIRNTTENNNYINPSKYHAKGAYDLTQQGTEAKMTHGETYAKNNYINPLKHHSKGAYDIVQQGTNAKNTNRETYSKNNYINPLKFAHSKGAYDLTQQGTDAKITNRETYSKNNYINPSKFAHTKSAYDIVQQGTTAKRTHRDTYAKNNYINPSKFVHAKGAYDFTQKGTTAKTTHRETYSKNNYINPSKFKNKQRSRADFSNALLNDVKEKSLKGRAPTTANYSKGPTLDYSMIQLCEPIQINRDLYPNMNGMNTLDCLPIAHNRIGTNQLAQYDWRLDSHVTENLQGNTFINNTQHKAVTLDDVDFTI